MKKDAPSTSYRLSHEARELLEFLAKDYGLSKTGVLEMLIRQEAERRQLRKHFAPSS